MRQYARPTVRWHPPAFAAFLIFGGCLTADSPFSSDFFLHPRFYLSLSRSLSLLLDRCSRTTHSDVLCIMNTTRVFREQVPEIAPAGSNKGTFKQQKERLCRLPYAGGKGSGLVKVTAAPATTLFAQQRATRSHAKTCRNMVQERDEFMAVSECALRKQTNTHTHTHTIKEMQ